MSDVRAAASIHHVELWIADLAGSRPRWDWLLRRLGWIPFQEWPEGRSWRAADGSYVVLEQSPALSGDVHERTRPGLNHLALAAADAATVDGVVAGAVEHGWELLYADQHPFAGGPEHYAGYLADIDGFEVEIVATSGS